VLVVKKFKQFEFVLIGKSIWKKVSCEMTAVTNIARDFRGVRNVMPL